MKLEKIYKNAKKHLAKEWGNLEFDYELESDSVDISGSFTLTKCGVGLNVLQEMCFCDTGLVMFDVTFDKLDATLENLMLVNKLNSETPFFKAYITDKGYLRLSRYVEIFDESEVASCLDSFFSGILANSLDEDMSDIIPRLHE